MVDASAQFYNTMRTRRSVRHFSKQPVPEQVIRNALLAAGTAPSGANLQPWHFAITTDPEVKGSLRALAEEEERNFTTVVPATSGYRHWHPWAPTRTSRFWKLHRC